jgi:hypothetical protein
VGLKFMPAFRRLLVEDRMPMRFGFTHRYCQQVLPDNASCFLRIGDWQGLGDKYFWNVGATMGAIDGGPPNFCTTMEGPLRYKSQEVCNIKKGNAYYDAIYTALRSRYRYVVNHDYGDKSLDQFMDIIDQVMKDNPDISLDFIRSLRITTDHCGFYPRKEQLPRIKNYGMMISCDPRFLNRSEPWLGVYGKQYANRIAPFKSILGAGIMVTAEMGQSYNLGKGEGTTPAAELAQMITRVNARGVSVAPEEAIDRNMTLKSQTVWGSYYVLKEKEIGTLEPGKLADFVVLNKDWFTVPDKDFTTIFPLMTVLGGKTIVLREELAKEMGVPPVGPQIKWEFKATYDFGDPLKPDSGIE